MNDWIKLFRKIEKWEWYKDGNTFRLFVHLLLKANWENGKFMGHIIPKGSLVTGRKKLAIDLGLSERSIRTSLEHLKSTNEITVQSTNRFSIITVVNYNDYQDNKNKTQSSKKPNNTSIDRPTTDHNIRNKEYKKERTTTMLSRLDVVAVASSVISYMNKKGGTSFKSTAKKTVELIAKLLNDGFNEGELKDVVYYCYQEWVVEPKEFSFGKMSNEFYRPSTIFGEKFENYLQEYRRNYD